ncbi:capsid [uncultured virus]|uniref:Capsid n=1 Tax=uncultured virus TaxID=340016 RepID=A0A2K9LSJ6_9VIRU|nr:capsid [uncultured virus]
MARRLRRRTSYRRRRTARRTSRRNYKSIRRPKSRVKSFSIRRSTGSTQIVHAAGAGGTPYYAGLQFQLSDLTNVSEFTNLFQQYRINCVVVSLIPNYNINQIPASGTGTNIPIIGWVQDFDDGSNPTSVPELQEYQRYKERKFTGPIKIKIWPAVSSLVFSSAGVDGFAVKKKMWIRTDVTTVKHYGLKYCVYNMAANQNYVWNIRYTMYASFKETK